MANRSRRNISSNLLSDEENEYLFSLLGKGCITLATAVVQLMRTYAPHYSKWIKHFTGVVCFVKDSAMQSYFIRVYDVDYEKQCVWEQEIYTTFEYKTPREYFHTFEAHDCMAGLNFADETEAELFKETVNSILDSSEERQQDINNYPPQTIQSSNIVALDQNTKRESVSQSFKAQKSSKKKKKEKTKKRKLKKEDIGYPTDFRRLTNIGWNPDIASDNRNTYKDLEYFFKLANVHEDDLRDAETCDFIYDFIDKNGGVKKAIEEANLYLKSPQLPTRNASTLQEPESSFSAPQFSLPSTLSSVPPPPPPPPPPPTGAMDQTPSESDTYDEQTTPESGSKSLLLREIKMGKKLNHFDPEINSSKSNCSNNGERDAFLAQIRQGMKLKTIDKNAARTVRKPGGGIAEALAKALQERSRANYETDENSSTSNEHEIDEDEWDD